MEDGLQLNINFQDQQEAIRKNKVDWRERKRQAHQKANARRQRGHNQPRPVVIAASHPRPAAEQPQSKRPKTHQDSHSNVPKAPVADSLHGYGKVLSAGQDDLKPQQQDLSKSPQQQQQHVQKQKQQSHQPHVQPKQQQSHQKQDQQQHRHDSHRKAAPGGDAGRVQPSNRPVVVKGALAKMQGAAESVAPTAEEQNDILTLVQLSINREQQLQQEQQQQPGDAAAVGGQASAAVVEFGDAEDEPNYADLAHKAHRKQQQHHHKSSKQQQGSSQEQLQPSGGPHGQGGSSSSGKGAKAGQGLGGQQKQQQQQQLAKHKAGELAHAELNVPAAARLQLFGPSDAVAGGGVSDDSSWSGLGLSQVLSAHLEALNFQEPTQVQKQAVPVLLGGHDALVRSPTGSGKTLAYLAPLVHHLAAAQPRITRADGTHAVVLVPTRELAVQVSDVLTALVRRFCWLVSGILIGGEHRGHEKARLRKGVTVLVATPGRLMDHLENTSSFNTQHLRWLVLDEADRLLDLGFEQKLKGIIAAFDSRSSNDASAAAAAVTAPKRRQTVLLSATLHPGLTSLACLSLCNPVGVGFKAEVVDGQLQLADTSSPDEAAAAAAAGKGGVGVQQQQQQGVGEAGSAFELPQQLQQKYVEVAAKMRLVYLIGVLQSRLRRSRAAKLVVFFSNCDSVDFHHELFQRDVPLSDDAEEPVKLLGAAPVLKLHGDMLQPERTSSLVTFSKAKSCVLLCTDVAARGLDFPAVSTIIQYDPAGDPAEYVHRVGRTARMGHKGEALLFLLHSELPYVELLQQRGMQLQEEQPSALLQCLPSLLGAADGRAAGSVYRMAKRLKLERKAAAADGGDAAGGDGGGGGGGGGSAGLSGAKAEQMAAALLLQRQLIQAIAGDQQLKQMALNAFRSFVRAYATHPTSLKHVFHVKSLHLGHLAACFGLREAPTKIGSSGATAERKKRKLQGQKATQKREKAAWHRTAKAAVADA